MHETEGEEHLPALPLVPAVSRPSRQLRFGRTEGEVVRVLLAQRERYCQSGSQESLCLTQDELAKQLGLPCETPAALHQAVRTLRQTIWRVNPKLATHDLIIASVHVWGSPRYAIFHLQEMWAAC